MSTAHLGCDKHLPVETLVCGPEKALLHIPPCAARARRLPVHRQLLEDVEQQGPELCGAVIHHLHAKRHAQFSMLNDILQISQFVVCAPQFNHVFEEGYKTGPFLSSWLEMAAQFAAHSNMHKTTRAPR